MRFALVMTADAGLLPGVHAMLNALKYYGDDSIEFHLLYWPSKEMDVFNKQMTEYYSNFRCLDVRSLIHGSDEERFRPVYYLKFYRSLYAGQMTDYDAVAYFDADRFITASIYQYFDQTVKTGKILMCDHKFDMRRYKAGFYNKYKIQGTNGCPYDSAATFFIPAVHGKYFEKVHEVGKMIGRGEMASVNYMLITDNLLLDVIPLPKHLWNLRNLLEIKMRWMQDIDGKCRLITDAGEHVVSIHGRYHIRGAMAKKAAKIYDKKWTQGHLIHNDSLREFLKVIDFFNWNCYTTINWCDKWVRRGDYIDNDGYLMGTDGLPAEGRGVDIEWKKKRLQ